MRRRDLFRAKLVSAAGAGRVADGAVGVVMTA